MIFYTGDVITRIGEESTSRCLLTLKNSKKFNVINYKHVGPGMQPAFRYNASQRTDCGGSL